MPGPGQGTQAGWLQPAEGGAAGGAEAPLRAVRARLASLPQASALSPGLRCSAASLVSWESEMKHCSSGREKLFCGRARKEAVSGGAGKGGPFPVSIRAAACAEEVSGPESHACRDLLCDSGQALAAVHHSLSICKMGCRGIP